MNNDIWLVGLENAIKEGLVANITFDKSDWKAFDGAMMTAGEVIKNDNLLSDLEHSTGDKGANVAAAAADKDCVVDNLLRAHQKIGKISSLFWT